MASLGKLLVEAPNHKYKGSCAMVTECHVNDVDLIGELCDTIWPRLHWGPVRFGMVEFLVNDYNVSWVRDNPWIVCYLQRLNPKLDHHHDIRMVAKETARLLQHLRTDMANAQHQHRPTEVAPAPTQRAAPMRRAQVPVTAIDRPRCAWAGSRVTNPLI